MCLAIPMRVKEVGDGFSIAEYKGVERRVSTMLIEDVREGDYLLIHAGFAISKVDRSEAEKTLSLLEKIAGMEGLE